MFDYRRGLFVFSDPGGAKPILSFVYNNNNINNYKIISDRDYDFFSDFNLEVNNFFGDNEEELLNEFKPDYLFTGTSYTSNIELRFIRAAKKLGIKCYSFIDHYTNYVERFSLNNVLYFPDKIFLVDNYAKEIALKNNISAHSELEVSGNFYHKFLKNWKPKTSRENIIKNYKIESNKKIIVFAPDPLSNINGKEKFLFDEIDVWYDFISAIEKIKTNDYLVIIKFHPNQDVKSFSEIVNKSSLKNIFYYENNLIDLLFHCDIIVGMFSSILVEANIFNKKIIRHIPFDNIKDPLEVLNIGLKSINKNDLQSNILNSFEDLVINS